MDFTDWLPLIIQGIGYPKFYANLAYLNILLPIGDTNSLLDM